MGLKPGYKQTELGVIPEDWELRQLGEIAEIRSGGTPSTKKAEFWNGGVSWCTPTDITALQGRKFLFETERAISSAGLRASSAEVIPPNSVIMTSRATIGECAINTVSMTTNQGFKNLIPSNFDHEFLYYLMTTQKERLIQLCGGSTFLEIGKKQLQQLEVTYPIKINEQRAIATALSDVDALLEGLDRLIAKKRDLKQAAMQQLLTGNTRLPGFEGEWDVRSLGEIGMFLKGKGIRRDDVSDEGIACIRYGELYTEYNDYITNPRSRISRNVADTALPLNHGDLLFAGSGETAEEIGKCATYLADEEAYAGGDIVVLRPSDQNSLYLGHHLNHSVVAEQKARLGQGDAVVHISERNLAQVVVKLPPLDEQQAIATILSDMDAEIEALEKRRTKTADLKQAMMQELLTGKTRLVEPQVSEEQTDAAVGNTKKHNWAFNKAVVIATLVKHFGNENYPLGRMRYTKLLYLLDRRVEKKAEGYLKKAAGPYNPQTRYRGPEKIAKKNGYIKQHKGPKGHSGFIAADNIAQAEGYFEKWYGTEVIQWLEKFRYKTNDELERLTTVDMAAVELRASGKTVDVAAVKDVIASNPEWEAKLDRAAFSDAKIAEAIKQSEALLGSEIAGGSHA